MAERKVRERGRACKCCGTQPITGYKYCSPKCSREYRAREKGVRPRAVFQSEIAAQAKIYQVRVCQGCGKTFRPKRTDRTKYCSRPCADDHRGQWQAKRDRLHHPSCPVRFTDCLHCRRIFCSHHGRVYCSGECSRAAYLRPMSERTCSDCGRKTFGTLALKRCRPCSNKRNKALYVAKHGKVKKHRHRARRFGVEYEAVNPLAVFERDGWKCQVCGRSTPKRLRGSYRDNAPELDHHVPMSAGGSHTWDNVQCCCRSCNANKGASVVTGQGNLFPHHQISH